MLSYGLRNALRISPQTVLPLPTAPPVLVEILALTGSARERAAERALTGGSLAPFLLEWVPVPVSAHGLHGTVFVSPDWMGIGTRENLFRLPLQAPTLQRVADHFGAMLPTQRIVDAIHHAEGAVHVPFTPERSFALARHMPMHASAVWVASHDAILRGLHGRTGLVTDASKDVVVGVGQLAHPHNVAIYGGWEADGARVQGLITVPHDLYYSDYSQRGRLIRRTMIAEGVERTIDEVAADPHLYPLVSDEGRAHAPLRYSTR